MSGIEVPRGYQDEGDYLVHMATEGRMTPAMFERIWQMQREEGWVYPRINRWNTRSYVHHPYTAPYFNKEDEPTDDRQP